MAAHCAAVHAANADAGVIKLAPIKVKAIEAWPTTFLSDILFFLFLLIYSKTIPNFTFMNYNINQDIKIKPNI